MAATTEQTLAPVPQVVARRVERERTGWTSWVTTTDHKRIGIMYLVLTFVFFILGGTEALQARMFEEMKGRIKEDDASVPDPDGPFEYLSRYEIGAQHPRHLRRRRGLEEWIDQHLRLGNEHRSESV